MLNKCLQFREKNGIRYISLILWLIQISLSVSAMEQTKSADEKSHQEKRARLHNENDTVQSKALGQNQIPVEMETERMATLIAYLQSIGKSTVLETIDTPDFNVDQPITGSSDTLLHIAAYYGVHWLAKKLIEKHASINRKNKSNYTPLYVAAQSGQTALVQLLLEHGADITIRGGRHDFTPCQIAHDRGHTEAAYLLEKYANAQGEQGVEDFEEPQSFLEPTPKECERNLIAFLNERGLEKILEIIGKPEFNVHQNLTGLRDTLLHIAAAFGVLPLVQRLVFQKGATIDARNSTGYTPLCLAVKNGFLEVTRFLLEFHANHDFPADRYNYTPLHFACKLGHVEIVRLLLQHNADVRAKDKRGLTPLHFACKLGNTSIVRLLVAHNADCTAKDVAGLTPIDYAKQWGNRLMSILQEVASNRQKRKKTGTMTSHDSVPSESFFELSDEDSERNEESTIHCDEKPKVKVNELIKRKQRPITELMRLKESLHNICISGNEKDFDDIVKLLQRVHRKIDTRGRTPLHIAAIHDNIAVARFLIEKQKQLDHFPDPDTRFGDPLVEDKLGRPPLYYAKSDEMRTVLKNAEDIHDYERRAMVAHRTRAQAFQMIEPGNRQESTSVQRSMSVYRLLN